MQDDIAPPSSAVNPTASAQLLYQTEGAPVRLRVLFDGLSAFTGDYSEYTLRRIIEAEPAIDVVAVTTANPAPFQGLDYLSGVELVHKAHLDFIELIDRLHERHSFILSEELLNRHSRTEYDYLSISDRRSLTNVPVHSRRRAYRQLLAYWYDFLISRRIEAVAMIAFPHAGWNNVMLDVAKALGLPVVIHDFTSIRETARVAEVDKLFERVPRGRYADLTLEQLRKEVSEHLLSGLQAPLRGSERWKKKRTEAETGLGNTPYLSLLAGFLRNPARRLRPSMTRLSGPISPLAMARHLSKAKRHTAALAAFYKQVAYRDPDLTRPYIYLSLHKQPERSTTPSGGVFEDQLLVAEILSASLPKGWVLLVKEHPSQFWQKRAAKDASFRDETYYRRLMSLPNTELVSLECESHDLIENARIVASVTGTAGWECLLRHKPCFVFGMAWYVGCNACFNISSVEECKAAIAEAVELSGSQVERDVLEFLLHYSNRILPVPFRPDRKETSEADYARYAATIAEAMVRNLLSQPVCHSSRHRS